MAAGEEQGAADAAGAAEQQLQELMMYAEQLRSELSSVEEQRQMFQEVLTDYARGREALKALSADDGERDVLVPLGGGNYVSAKLVNAGKVLTSIGSNTHVEGTVDAALKRIDAREEQAKQAADRLNEEGQKLMGELTRINQQMQTLQQGAGREE